MSGSTTIILALGDADMSDAFDLNDGLSSFTVPSSLKLPPPFIRTFRSRHLGTTQTTDPFRTITIHIDCYAPDEDTLVDAVCEPIERKLQQAEANSGTTPEDGRGVVLWLAMGQSGGLTLYDVDSGSLNWVRDDAQTGATPFFTLELELKCKPFARDQQVTYTLPTLTIGQNAVAFLPNLPGDRPGLVQMQLNDLSTGSVAIDRYRIGIYSMEGMASTDFQPWVAATPYGNGAIYADATALNGVNCARVTMSGAYQSVALVRQPAAAIRTQGKLDAFLLCRDASTILSPPSNLTLSQPNVITGGGTRYGWVTQCTFVVTAVDASGNETQASTPVTMNYRGDYQSNFAWVNPGSVAPSHYRLYAYNLPPATVGSGSGAGNGIWEYLQLSGSLTSITMATTNDWWSGSPTAVAQNPPTSGSQATGGAVIQPYVGLVGTTGQPTALIACPQVATAIGNGVWEMVPLGMYPLPATSLPEGRAGMSLPWCVRFDAAYLGVGTPTFDIGGVLLIKHESPSNETRLGPANNGVPVLTTIDTNRREQVGAWCNSQYAAPSRTNLVAEYLMNQGSGTSLTDTSGSGNTGTLQTGSGWALDSAISGVTGPSNAISVAGGSGVTFASLTNIPIGNSHYSIVALVKPTVAAGTVVTWGAVGANTQTALLISATGATASWDVPNLAYPQYLLGNWHMLIVTWDGTTRLLYLDGVQVASDTPAAHAATAASFAIGGGFTGRIGPLRIYSRNISAFEAAQMQGQIADYVGQAVSIGKLFAGPGNAIMVIDADVAGYAHDTVNAKVQPTVLFTPRYGGLRGLTL